METSYYLEFHIITPYKGPEEFLIECKNSVKNQLVKNNFRIWHHVVIDNDNNGACRNHFETLQKIDPKKTNIIIHLDGDDKLIDENTLNYLFQIYQNDDTWATYGNYVSRQGSICKPIEKDVPFRISFIKSGWKWSHLRTFRANLIPFLKKEDMLDSAGNWFTSAPDVAIFLPILEMCGNDRVKFIDRDFVYYRLHDNNEHSSKQKLNDQIRCAVEIMHKPSYDMLK